MAQTTAGKVGAGGSNTQASMSGKHHSRSSKKTSSSTGTSGQ